MEAGSRTWEISLRAAVGGQNVGDASWALMFPTCFRALPRSDSVGRLDFMYPRISSPTARWVAVMLVLIALPLSWLACSSGDDKSTSLGDEPSLSLTASPTEAKADGTAVTLSVSAMSGPGKPGSGSLSFSAARGSFDGGSATESATLDKGAATIDYACNAEVDPGCVGMQTVTVTWNGLTDTTGVYFTGSVEDAGADVTDAATDVVEDVSVDGPAEAGPDADPDAAQDADPDAGEDAMEAEAAPPPSLALSSAQTTIFADVGDYTVITAVLTADAGGPVAGEEILFTTNLGLLAMPAGPPPDPAATQTVVTDANGEAEIWLTDDGVDGLAKVTAQHVESGLQKETFVTILKVQQISHAKTTCSGSTCTIMGIKGSGFNEQAQVSFDVVDANGDPAEGVTVNFSISNPPTGTTVSPSSITDGAGRAVANVSAGPLIGAFTVKAVVVAGMVEAESPTIGIRGAMPANRGFSLQCSPVNVGAYVSPTPPRAFEIDCDVKVVDRYNNPVGTGTPVNFKVEAGAIPNSINTKAYTPSGSNTDEGTGTVVFQTVGTWPAVDVAPLSDDATQWPLPRMAEPSRMVGAAERNPRDGLVSVLAYLRGEEFFQDDNSNGTRDPGEMFVDQGEPFVDSNDNGIRDVGEVYIDEAPADGQWNAPNGQWDNNTSIWVETRILYTGLPVVPHSKLVPNPFGTIPRGGTLNIEAYFADDNMNRAQAQSTSFKILDTATKGSVSWKTGNLLDAYGFGIERRLLDASSSTDCTPTSQICVWRTLFYDWGEGYVGYGEIKGAPLTDTSPPQANTVSVEATVLQNKVTIEATGTME